MKLIIALWVLLTLHIYALPQAIKTFINSSTINPKDVSIYIKEIGKSTPLVSLNAGVARTPASVIKVLSTYASVLKLGFDYKIPTKFYISGHLNNGILNGDLIVKGYGDPTLNTKDLKNIVEQIKQKGLRQIRGNIVIDRSYFRVGTKDSSGFDENKYSAYNAMPDAMMFNERVSTICLAAHSTSVHKKVSDGSYQVINKLQGINKPCRGRYSWPGIRIDKSSTTPKVWLQGKLSTKCGRRNICKVLTKPYKTFYYALKSQLKLTGISVSGSMRLRKVPQNAKYLLTHYSRSLEKIVSKTAKKSNNLYARHLLLILGAKTYGAPATLSKGRRAVEAILRSKGALGHGTLKIDNGCGLSRWAKVTSKLLGGMFENAYHRHGTRWMKTLSIAGIDGTIKRRFRGSIVKNRAWMKTGTLNRVKNIGGYVKSKSGKLYSVVILVNSNRGNWRSSKLENDVIKWLVSYPSPKREKHIANKHIAVHELMKIETKKPLYIEENESILY